MMDVLKTTLLGVIQGATEFLPISSSAHLVIAQAFLDMESPGVLLEVMLHLGTLLSVVIYFRKDLWMLVTGGLSRTESGPPARREIAMLVVATIPAVLVALTWSDRLEAAFESVPFAGWMLLVTSLVLVSARFTGQGDSQITFAKAALIGLAQALAIFPGISRSGITIVAGLWLGLSGTTAARFSFLMALPAILGAALFNLSGGLPDAVIPGLMLGVAAAALTGYAVIAWLMQIIAGGRLYLFAGYTILAGLGVIFWL